MRTKRRNYFVFTTPKDKLSFTISPLDSRKSSYTYDCTYAPITKVERIGIGKGYLDWSPSLSTNDQSYWEPYYSLSQKYKLRYAPSIKLKSSYTFAPESSDSLVYQPLLVTRFKPQPVIITNSDTLDSYFRFLVQLLRVLR